MWVSVSLGRLAGGGRRGDNCCGGWTGEGAPGAVITGSGKGAGEGSVLGPTLRNAAGVESVGRGGGVMQSAGGGCGTGAGRGRTGGSLRRAAAAAVAAVSSCCSFAAAASAARRRDSRSSLRAQRVRAMTKRGVGRGEELEGVGGSKIMKLKLMS